MIAFMLLASVLSSDACISGVPVGKRPGPYSFLVATGPHRGQLTCYVCEQADKPTVIVFARRLSKPLATLLQRLDQETTTRSSSGFKAWMTLLTDTADLEQLAKWSQMQGLKAVPVGAFEDIDGPPAYTLAEEAEVTVLLFVKRKVVANFAFRPGELSEANVAEIGQALPQLFPQAAR